MDLFSLIFIGVGLAMDCFAVSLGIGTSNMARSFRPVFRLSFHFGLFQGLMTLLGWLVGSIWKSTSSLQLYEVVKKPVT